MQVNDSQVSHPTIVFRVNLETLNRQGSVLPNRSQTSGNETTSEADAQRDTRTLWIPGLLGGEHLHGEGYKHGDTFTVKGHKAVYLKRLYVTGSVEDLLQIVSEA